MVNKNFVAKLYNYCNTQLKCHQEKKEQKKKKKSVTHGLQSQLCKKQYNKKRLIFFVSTDKSSNILQQPVSLQ